MLGGDNMRDTDLDITLLGGQSFSWQIKEDYYEAVLADKVFRIRSLADVSDPFLKGYFDMTFPYEKARKELSSRDCHLASAVARFPGLRILRQDPFLVMISFILSQNNNIPRITKIYRAIASSFGEEVEEGCFSFPSRDRLSSASADDFYALGAGFRASYLVDAVDKASLLQEVEELPYEEARERLQLVRGIGPKVADCILLFGFHRMEAFPMDVWMKKVMGTYYPGVDAEYFAPYQALAQQYLFSWAREGKGKEGFPPPTL